jgi:hypothetical protein
MNKLIDTKPIEELKFTDVYNEKNIINDVSYGYDFGDKLYCKIDMTNETVTFTDLNSGLTCVSKIVFYDDFPKDINIETVWLQTKSIFRIKVIRFNKQAEKQNYMYDLVSRGYSLADAEEKYESDYKFMEEIKSV